MKDKTLGFIGLGLIGGSIYKSLKKYGYDFDSIKKILGIEGEYVERKGDLYSPTFDPKRNVTVLTLPQKEMETRAEKVYKDLIQELNEISKIIDKKF